MEKTMELTGREQGRRILRRLEQAGFQAYFVGGCVRDLLLGRPVHDWDIATSARPEQILALFPHCVPTGLRHGTVSVLEGVGAFEVTTFRADCGYEDGRHPDRVRFLPELREDLRRRDFTINAMAMDAGGVLTDLCGGREDLESGLIRCVGEPARRFSEDALRLLRAVRFSAQLGFAIEPETDRALEACAPLCARLSAERVRDEMEKTLLSPQPGALKRMLETGMLSSFGLAGSAPLRLTERAACERAARWAALLVELPGLDLRRLRLDRKTAALCAAAAAAYRPSLTEAELKRLVADRGWEVARCVCRINGQAALADALAASGQCVTLAQLAVTGRDLPQYGGRAVGVLLRELLAHVLEHPEENTKARLLELAEAWGGRPGGAAPGDAGTARADPGP